MIKNIFISTILLLDIVSVSAQDISFDPQIEILKWKYGFQSAFSFSFDDGLLSHYQYAKPILDEHGFKGTFYLLPPFLTENLPGIWRYGTWPMFLNLNSEGHEIGSHTLNHPALTSLPAGDTITQNTIQYELYHSRRQIEFRTNKQCVSLAYPYSDHSPLVDSLTARYYQTGRSVGPLPNNDSLPAWYGLASFPVTFSLPRNAVADDLDELNEFIEWVDSSIANNSWGIIMIHEVVPFSEIGSLINLGLYEPMSTEWLSLFSSSLQLRVSNAEVWVETIGNITRYISERENSEYNIISITDDEIKFRMMHNLNPVIYNYPLSVLVTVPDHWLNAFFNQGLNSDSLKIFNSHLGRTVMCEVVPDGSIFTISRNPLTVINDADPVISSFILKQNYPNPFNPGTKIGFSIPPTIAGAPSVRLIIYDVLGREIAVLVDQKKPAGNYEVNFPAPDELPSGIYFYRLQVENFSSGTEHNFIETKKMILVR